MNLYQPQQNLSFQQVAGNLSPFSRIPISTESRVYLKSTVSVLVDANETLTRIYNEKDPLLIIYKTVKNERNTDRHVFNDVVLINKVPEGPKVDYFVKVIVYKIDGAVGGEVTTTIAGNATIELD
jgi:hypothetical protein